MPYKEIFITNIRSNITELHQDDGTVLINLNGYTVDFIINLNIKAQLTIPTEREMDKIQIKAYIVNKIW